MARSSSGLTAVRQTFENVLVPPNTFTPGAASFSGPVRDGKGHSEIHAGVLNGAVGGTLKIMQAWISGGVYTEVASVALALDPTAGVFKADVVVPVVRRFTFVLFTPLAGGLQAGFQLGAYFQPRTSPGGFPAAAAGPVSVTTTPTPNRGSFATNQKNVAVAATAEQLQAQAIPDGFSVAIKAKSGNTNPIWVGNSQANAQDHTVAFELKAGEVMRLYITNTNLVWIDATTAGEGVNWVVET